MGLGQCGLAYPPRAGPNQPRSIFLVRPRRRGRGHRHTGGGLLGRLASAKPASPAWTCSPPVASQADWEIPSVLDGCAACRRRSVTPNRGLRADEARTQPASRWPAGKPRHRTSTSPEPPFGLVSSFMEILVLAVQNRVFGAGGLPTRAFRRPAGPRFNASPLAARSSPECRSARDGGDGY